MPSELFSVPQAVNLGKLVLAAYDLFTQGDPDDFLPPAGYRLVSKIYADDITDDSVAVKVFGFIGRMLPRLSLPFAARKEAPTGFWISISRLPPFRM